MEHNIPKISVFCLSYNTGKYILETLASIKDQNFKDFELLISDDASTDNTATLIEAWIKQYEADFKYPIRFHKNETNKGIVASLNLMLQQSKGEYYSLICDDYWYPQFLEKLYAVIVPSEESVAFAYTDTYIVDFETKKKWEIDINPVTLLNQQYPPQQPDDMVQIRKGLYRFKSNYIYKAQFVFNPIIAFTVLVKSKIVKDLGGYDEQFYFEDMPMWFKLNKTYDCLFVDEKLAHYNRHAHNITASKNIKYHKSVLDVYFYFIRKDRLNKNDSHVKNRIFLEWGTIVAIWKNAKAKNGKAFWKITKRVFQLYPMHILGMLKSILKK